MYINTVKVMLNVIIKKKVAVICVCSLEFIDNDRKYWMKSGSRRRAQETGEVISMCQHKLNNPLNTSSDNTCRVLFLASK